MILKTAKEIYQCGCTSLIRRLRQQETIYIGWKHSQDEQINIKCDEAYKNSNDVAYCGDNF